MDDDAIYSALGQAVAVRRKKLRLTQAQVAQDVGMSRASIANIEAGRQKVLLHQVYGLVTALDLKSIADLVPLSPPRASIVEGNTEIATSGAPVTDAQLSGLEQLIQMALDQQGGASRR